MNHDPEKPRVNNMGIPEAKIVFKNNGYYKQVLHNITGYVRSKEMVAIMGPSGSGKTSLLNVLAQRTSLSEGSQVEGVISINFRNLV
jgi:ABC-type lipoprotein export system ATPase subunit